MRSLKDSLKDSLEKLEVYRAQVFHACESFFNCLLKENNSSSDSSDSSEEISKSSVICLVISFSLTVYLHYFKDT